MNPSKFALVLLLLAAAGCGAKRMAAPVVTAADEESTPNPGTYEAMNRFAATMLAFRAQAHPAEDVVIAPSSTYHLMAVLLNASEEETLDGVYKAMQMDQPRTDRLNPALRFLDNRMKPITSYHAAESYWFIWPMPLDEVIPQKMERSFGVKVTRLGSAGVGATREVNNWVEEHGFAKDFHHIRLNKNEIYRSYSLVRLADEVQGPFQMLQKGSQKGWRASTRNGLSLACFELPEDQKIDVHFFGGWSVAEGGQDNSPVPSIQARYQESLRPTMESMKLGSLFTGPVDMRYLSVEMQGIYPMADMEQSVDVKIETDRGSSKPKKPLVWALREPKTGAILLCGLARS